MSNNQSLSYVVADWRPVEELDWNREGTYLALVDMSFGGKYEQDIGEF